MGGVKFYARGGRLEMRINDFVLKILKSEKKTNKKQKKQTNKQTNKQTKNKECPVRNNTFLTSSGNQITYF